MDDGNPLGERRKIYHLSTPHRRQYRANVDMNYKNGFSRMGVIGKLLARCWPREALGCRKVFDRCRYCSKPAEPCCTRTWSWSRSWSLLISWPEKEKPSNVLQSVQAGSYMVCHDPSGWVIQEFASGNLRSILRYVKVQILYVIDASVSSINSKSGSPFKCGTLGVQLCSAYLSSLSMSLGAVGQGLCWVGLRKTSPTMRGALLLLKPTDKVFQVPPAIVGTAS